MKKLSYSKIRRQLAHPVMKQGFFGGASRPAIWIYGVVLGIPILVFGGIALQPWVPVDMLLEDPLRVAEKSSECCDVYYGAVSNLGVLVWAATVGVLALATFELMAEGEAGPAWFTASGAALTGLLAADDLFLIHDGIAPHFGVDERYVLMAYILLAGTYATSFRRFLLQGRRFLFGIAVAAFALSVAIDIGFVESDSPLRLISEDGAKFVGILAWAAFQTDMALRLARGCGAYARRGQSRRTHLRSQRS